MTIDKFFKLDIIFKHQDWLIINKPAGILVQPNKYSPGKNLVDFLITEYPEIKNIGQIDRPGIVHRLDKDVSGLMIIARTEKFYHHIIQQFQESKVKKEYLALVHGCPAEDEGMIDLPLARTKDGKIVAVKYRGELKNEQDAKTEYRVIHKYQNYSLLKVNLLTGRTNQIRVHLRAINCPIVGDKQYGFKDKKQGEELNRVFLHAAYLGFNDLNNNWREFRSELPEELNSFLNQIRQ